MMRYGGGFIVSLVCLCASAIDIQGRVLDPEGKPVAGADVWLSRERIVTTTKTDETGTFAFREARPGRMSVTARKSELSLTGLTGHLFDNLTADLHMKIPDTVRIRVIDHAGNAVEGARVKRLVIDGAFEIFPGDLAQYGFPSLRSDADGALVVHGIPPESYITVTLEHRNFCDLFLPYLVPHPREHPAQMYPGQVFRGHITRIDQTGVPNARVLLFREDDGRRLLMYDVLTDAEGYFRSIIPPATYSIEVHHPDYPTPAPEKIQIEDSLNETIFDATLPAAHTIEGTVIGPDKNPMSGVALTYLVDDFPQDEAFTDGKGTYRLIAAAGEGRVHVIPPSGYMTADPVDIVIRIEKIAHTNVPPIALEKIPSLKGRIVIADQPPKEPVLVKTLNLKNPLYVLTNAEGKFEIILDTMPEEKEVELRAEHPLRFLRRDFEIGIRKQEENVTVALRPFQPDLHPNDPQKTSNDLSALVDKPAPRWTCQEWVNSDEIALDDLQGKVVVLVLWAGFDPYGTNAAPLTEVNLLHTILAETTDDVAFIGIHDDSDPADVVKGYMDALGIVFPVGVDASPMVTHRKYNATVLPQVILIDKKGMLRYFDVEGRLPELIKDLRRRP